MTEHGHLFVIDGDLTKLHCDAILIPVDNRFLVTRTWEHLLGTSGFLQDVDRPAGWGTSVRAMPYRMDGTREIWLGDIGRSRADDSWYADGLVEFVRRASAAGRRRLAVNVAGSGHGGSAHDKGRLYNTIVPALRSAARETGSDVVLVCWGEQSYAAAQRTRLRLHDDPITDGRLQPTVERLADHARRKDLVLFIGAGVSKGAGLKSWTELLKSMLEHADRKLDNDSRLWELDVRDQAHLISRRYDSPERYRAQLAREVDAGRYALAHGLLASLAAREAVTTNYDQLYELAVRTAGRACAVLPYEPVTDQGRWLLKLHGSVDRPEDMVLTREDYLGLPARAGALFGVLQAMLLTRHMLFVGYSLSDDTFHKVMHEVRQARAGHQGKVGTVLVLFEDPLLEAMWGDDLDIVAMAPRPAGVTFEEQRQAAARKLECFLDAVCLHAADVTSFMLDDTYRSTLDPDEAALVDALRTVANRAEASTSPLAKSVTRGLRNWGAS